MGNYLVCITTLKQFNRVVFTETKQTNESEGDMGNNQEMVMRMVIRRQVTLIISLSIPNQSDLSPLDIQCRKDTILGLPHLTLRLVELPLRVRPLLESSGIVLIVGEVGKNWGEFGVRLDE